MKKSVFIILLLALSLIVVAAFSLSTLTSTETKGDDIVPERKQAEWIEQTEITVCISKGAKAQAPVQR